jgi:hypothetical protein
MPSKRKSSRSKSLPKPKRLSTIFADIEESTESFSKPPTIPPLNVQLAQLHKDFDELKASLDILSGPTDISEGAMERAKLALEVFGATLDGISLSRDLE